MFKLKLYDRETLRRIGGMIQEDHAGFDLLIDGTTAKYDEETGSYHGIDYDIYYTIEEIQTAEKTPGRCFRDLTDDERDNFVEDFYGLVDLNDLDTPRPWGCPWIWAESEKAVTAAEWMNYYRADIENLLAEEVLWAREAKEEAEKTEIELYNKNRGI